MSIKRRIRKLETLQSKTNGGLVIIAYGPNDDAKELQRERFGLDGPPLGVTVLLVNTGVSRSKE
ncbi:MAG: hypothetical protein CFH03_02271 [Alphaproteobacteria bacterium MarineAlpha3_Bin2]|nr:MAG: hypothetical protein CFH03_02271 [Alphaproteobacteria bacterium MarineAlpha3_Bin2]